MIAMAAREPGYASGAPSSFAPSLRRHTGARSVTIDGVDPIAYRKHLLGRILRIAGAGTAGLAALAAADCGSRSNLGVEGSSAAGTSGTGGAGGHGGALTMSGSGGSGGTIGFASSASSTSGVTVGVGGASPDGGATEGTACIDVGPGNPCPMGDAAIAGINLWLGPCEQVVAIVSGPTQEGTLCCYEVLVQPFPCYVGRTFFIDEGIVKADARAGRTWRAGPTPDVDRIPPATRRALADAWARDGLFEHASVASFARFAMQLLALGAPADLVRDTHAGAIDEVRHAELCLTLASAYAGSPLEPAALPIPGPVAIVPDLPAIAAEVAMEGAIGETVATVQALDALAAATDPAVRAVLEQTVADETRHAELAWRFLAWAIDQGGEATREAVLRAFLGFCPPAPRVEQLDGVDLALYAAHGRQRAPEGRAIAERALAEIVRPGMCALLATRGHRAPADERAAAAVA